MVTRRVKVGIVLVLLVTAFTDVVLYFCFSPAWRFNHHYDALKLGMTESELHNLFGRPPDYESRYRGVRVLYYSRGTFLDSHPEGIPAVVTDKAHIPKIYGAAQIAIGSEATVVAYSWNGETLTIRTTRGDVHGSDLSKLDETFFD